VLALKGGGWSATLLPERGAAMARLAFRGVDALVPLPGGVDPNAAFCGAFVMAPWANRLDAGRLPADGTLYRLPVNRPADHTAIHGLARDRPWRVVRSDGSTALLTQTMDGAAEHPALPWHYSACLEVELSAAGATIALRLVNRADRPFPFGLGWHPFLWRPRGTRLRFAASGLLIRDARCLPVAARPSAGVDGDETAYEGLDTHFTGWSGVAELDRPDGMRLRLTASGAASRNLQVFAPWGEPVLCVEPVSHVPDAPNRPELARLGSMTTLSPGEALATRITLAALPR
jgi:aldose 1-epimerase